MKSKPTLKITAWDKILIASAERLLISYVLFSLYRGSSLDLIAFTQSSMSEVSSENWQHNDQRMIDQLESRIEAHKFRIDMGKGEVMGKDGMPVDVKYDKDVKEAHPNSKIYDKCWKGYKKVPGKKRGEPGSCVKKE